MNQLIKKKKKKEIHLPHLANKGDLPYEQAIEKIFANALRLQDLANNILDVARIEAGQLSCVMRQVSLNRDDYLK
jgi:signal transduction histidine kinase